MYKEHDIITYKDCVRRLCLHSAQIGRLALKAEAGCMTNTDRRMLCHSLSMVNDYKGFLLSVMKRMGIDGGLSFMEDNEFMGFSVRSGRLYTEDKGVVVRICRKWVYGFPDEANAYQYAAGMYAICLAYADEVNLRDLYPAYIFQNQHKSEEAA